MAVIGVPLPLFDEPYYSYNVALESNSYTLRYVYNERMSMYLLDLLDSDLTPLVLGVGLVPAFPICTDYAIAGISGFFWLQQKASSKGEPYKDFPTSLSQYYDFYYVYTTQD